MVGPTIRGIFEEVSFPHLTVGWEGIHPPPDIVWGCGWAGLGAGV